VAQLLVQAVKAQFFKQWNRIKASFWFLPSVMAIAAMLLAGAAVVVDERATGWMADEWGWTFAGGAEGASSVLRTIASSMTTIAGVVFSITLVALSITSSQLGPRLLRTFMRDTPTKFALGTFVATFLYCLLVLQTIRRPEEGGFVPHLSVSIALILAVASMAMLIYFIHHVSVSIRANEIVARVHRELLEVIDKLFPADIGRSGPRTRPHHPEQELMAAFERDAYMIEATEDGYVQFVDGDELMALARQHDVIIRLERRPGDYVVTGRPLLKVWPGERVNDKLVEKARASFALGNERTPGQDIEFSVAQLVEIAVRSLSPSMNDPFTAITCLDRLGSALSRVAQRDTPSPYRLDQDHDLRVIAPPVTFPEIIDAAFHQVRQHCGSSVAVTRRLLQTILVVAAATSRADDRAALLRHARLVAQGAAESMPEEEDRRAVEKCFQDAVRVLTGPG
jgi:uncharacterized membrane protein